jgi:hypothetical protein
MKTNTDVFVVTFINLDKDYINIKNLAPLLKRENPNLLSKMETIISLIKISTM